MTGIDRRRSSASGTLRLTTASYRIRPAMSAPVAGLVHANQCASEPPFSADKGIRCRVGVGESGVYLATIGRTLPELGNTQAAQISAISTRVPGPAERRSSEPMQPYPLLSVASVPFLVDVAVRFADVA